MSSSVNSGLNRGRIFARLAVQNGRTRLVEHHQNAPLKIARCFETAGGGLEICVMDASPGLLAGDCHQYEWIVEAGAKLRVTTQGATRIHPSSGPISRQTVRFHVAAGARLELWPDTVIPFRAARFESKIEGFLEEGALLLLLDSLSAGRVARGETFEFERILSQITVSDALGPRVSLRNRLVPAEIAPHSALSWNGATQLTNLFAFGLSDEKIALEAAQQILDEAGQSGGVSSLSRGGLAVSWLGRRAFDGQTIASLLAKQWQNGNQNPK